MSVESLLIIRTGKRQRHCWCATIIIINDDDADEYYKNDVNDAAINVLHYNHDTNPR